MVRNVASLYVLQFILYFIPLFVTPYLTRTLGVELFGVIAVCGSIVAYLSLLSNWGFDLSASQLTAQACNDPSRLRVIFWDTLLAKVGLGVLGFLIMGVIVLASPTIRPHWFIMLATGISLVGNMFGVNWFLQGLERMGAFAVVSLVGRALSIPLTFLLVHSPKDAALAVGIQGFALCISAAASIYAAGRLVNLRPARVNVRGALDQITGGTRLFLSTAAISLYTYTNLLAVGFLAGPAQAGLFDGADRMKRAATSLTGPLTNAAYPRLNRMVVHARDDVRKTMLILLAVQGALSVSLSLAIFIGAQPLTLLFLGRAYVDAVPITRWLSWNIALIGISNVLGINMMLPLGMKRAFTTIILGSGLLNLILLFLLVPVSHALGAAQAVTMTEALVTVAMAAWLVVHRHAV